MWARSGYTSEAADGTVQMNAKAIGEVTAIGEIVDQIEALEALNIDEGVERVPS